MLKEIEVKQKQLLKMLQLRENAEAKHKINKNRNSINGKVEDAVELLIMLAKENKEDAKDIKLKVQETQNEIADIDKRIRT